ncbi:hypothetical protein FQA39_LY16901 [Lamprigera yunnana]|nr:hypothetical protein FQA39_LY16901 [Lamprigera yunnana]
MLKQDNQIDDVTMIIIGNGVSKINLNKILQQYANLGDPHVRTSITLLACVEVKLVIRALNTLAKYADEKDSNVSFLYHNGVVPKLQELLAHPDLIVLRFALKLLSQIVSVLPDAAAELSYEKCSVSVKQIAYLFANSADKIVKELSVQFLACIVMTASVASTLLKMGLIITVFDVLKTSQDPDTQYNTLIFFNHILEAPEAIQVIPKLPEFSSKTIMCYFKHQEPPLRTEALNVIEKLASWKSDQIQSFFKEAKLMESLFQLIMSEEYKELHKKCLDIILICMKSLETATYFAKTLEFLEFCQWSKTCPKKYILPSAKILSTLTKEPSLKQLLFDFSVEDAILSYLRVNNEMVFLQVCESISSMSLHMYCCDKIVTPVVIKCLLEMLQSGAPFIPYHECTLNTLLNLLKRNLKTMRYVVCCGGVDVLRNVALKDKSIFTYEGYYNMLYILYMFSNSTQYKFAIITYQIYKNLLETFVENSDYSQLVILIMDQYVESSEYRQYFLELEGAQALVNLLTSTPSRELFKNTLLFIERIFIYKDVCMAFMWLGLVKLLEMFSTELKKEIPLIDRLITSMYDFYLPLKFYKKGRLEVFDHLESRFYLVTGYTTSFPFLEILERMNMNLRTLVYVVDFSADVTELTMKSLPKSEKDGSSIRSSIKKNGKSKTKQHSILKSGAKQERSNVALVCRVPPPIRYGHLSEDPYLPQYIAKIKTQIYENDTHVLCFRHQIRILATFVDNLLSGMPYPGNETSQRHCMDVHLTALKQKLGTSLIPLGYLRYGFHCEKSLLFKVLADKIGIPATLVRGDFVGRNNLIYWNEVPIICNENIDGTEDSKTYMAYAVVDLMDNIGNLMIAQSPEANKYCGIPSEDEKDKSHTITLKNLVDT